MPDQLSTGVLIASISDDMADNNAGFISAEDVRHNMEDTVFSIRGIVASGETESTFTFYNPIVASSGAAGAAELNLPGATSGDIIVESGIFFSNQFTKDKGLDDKRQVQPWLGAGNIDHGSLAGLSDDDHPAYYNIDGTRALTGNMKTNGVWINASGTDLTGLKFRPDVADDATSQTILVSGHKPVARREEAGYSNAGGFEFMDKSIVPNGKGMAKAWIQLNTSGIVDGVDDRPEVFSYHNISGVDRRGEGKFDITFTSGTFEHNRYVAVGTANGTTTNSSREDFEDVFVGIVTRNGDDGNTLRKCEVAIKDTAGAYQDSEMVDIVFFGYSPGESSGIVPTVSRGSDA
jgi:hypothetical protein